MTNQDKLRKRGKKAYATIEALKILYKNQGRKKAEVETLLSKATGCNFKALKDGCGMTKTGIPRLKAIEAVEDFNNRLYIDVRKHY